MDLKTKKTYRSLYKTAFFSTIIMLVIIPLQILVFILTKMPATTVEWFSLFHENILVGFFHADFFILVNNILIAVIYVAFYHTLKEVNKGIIQIGLVLGIIGISAYISSNRTFELLRLSQEYFASSNETEKTIIEVAGKVCLLGWQGTAFDAYYVLNGIALFCISMLMFKSKDFSKACAAWGFLAAVFMIIPSTAGSLGLIFSLLSLIPWYVFSILFAKRFLQLSKPE